jgi:integrase
MVENDIYNNKQKYESFKRNLSKLTIKSDKLSPNKKQIFYCKNPANIEYYRKLCEYFETRDLSYIRRMRVIGSLKLITYATEIDLKECDRDDVNKIVTFMHTRYKSPKSKGDFIRDLKYLWKNLLPELDERGRIDETLIPYAVRHLSAKIDKSRERIKGDKLTVQEYERFVNYFNEDPRMQCYVTLAVESLGRPQELLYLRIKDIEIYDNYAKIWISEHGKEGTGFLQCIDSFPYLMKWLKKHSFAKNKDAFLFFNMGNSKFGAQWSPYGINKIIKKACSRLHIDKPVTCYSLKRNGVTFRRLKGDSDVQIQHAARWTSTKQLKNYDMSDQEDAMKIELIKRGKIIAGEKMKQYEPKTKKCVCGSENGFTDQICGNCARPLDRRKIVVQEKFMEIPEIKELFAKVLELKGELV